MSASIQSPFAGAAWATTAALVFVACVPSGSSPPQRDAGGSSQAAPTPTFTQSANVMKAVFEDNFDRAMGASASSSAVAASASAIASARPDASLPPDAARPKVTPDGAASDARADGLVPRDTDAVVPTTSNLGSDWVEAKTNAWRIENGRLCGQGAKNHGVWLNRTLPVNARIEFDAISESAEGDIKAEAWGDGQSSASGLSYNDATSYLTILGGWKNTFHVLARINEHGADRKEIKVDKDSDDPREKPVAVGQIYRFKIERTDGKTVRWSVNGLETLTFQDSSPLAGAGHDHFGFNNWQVKVCYDNVRITPLP